MTTTPHAHSIVVVPRRARPTPVVTVARLVSRPDVDDLPVGSLDLGGGARLDLGRFRPAEHTWAARARLRVPGLHAARFARVAVDITPWSASTWELSVRPVSRQVSAWGRRRRHRYFTLAHAAADQLARQLSAPCPPPRGARRVDFDHRAAPGEVGRAA